MRFSVDGQYTRSDVFDALGLDPHPVGGTWFTGYVQHHGEWFIFCHVGAAGRTGHDYGNHFTNDELFWRGKTGSHKGQKSIRELTNPTSVVHIFYRTADRGPFTYAGRAHAEDVQDTVPVTVLWSFPMDGCVQPGQSAQEIPPNNTYKEGSTKRVMVNAYERNPQARAECIDEYGVECSVCRMDFESMYGDIGKGFIHVHHLIPLHTLPEGYEVNPKSDLCPVCPNCHAMLHRRNPPYTVDELRVLLSKKS